MKDVEVIPVEDSEEALGWALRGQVEFQQCPWAGGVCRLTCAESGHPGTFREFSLLGRA